MLAVRTPALRETTALTAAGSLSVAALSLVAERAEVELLGFSLALGIPETAATHGVLNALGVGVCALLAWRRAGVARL
jgi:hypothetical protein